MIMEYSTRTLTPSVSTGSFHDRNNLVAGGGRLLTPSPSTDSSRFKINHHQMSSLHAPGTLGQSLSVTSLLSVESDSSAPAPVAPPRSAQLNTGEVLQPYQLVQLQASASNNALMAHSSQVQHGYGQSGRAHAQPPRHPHHPPAMGQTMAQPMAIVHPQSVISREPPHQAPAPEPPQQTSDNGTQSTWVIEEVIDFGQPLDEGLVRECDDIGYPMGCKNTSRGNVNLFDGCVHNVCIDEEQVRAMQGDREDVKVLC